MWTTVCWCLRWMSALKNLLHTHTETTGEHTCRVCPSCWQSCDSLTPPPPFSHTPQCYSLSKRWLWGRRFHLHGAGCKNSDGKVSPFMFMEALWMSNITTMKCCICPFVSPGWGASTVRPCCWVRGGEGKPPRCEGRHQGSEVCCGTVVHFGSCSRRKGKWLTMLKKNTRFKCI